MEVNMKDKLRSQLEEYKRDNTKSSKENLVMSLDSLNLNDYGPTSNMVKMAREVLSAENANKVDIVQAVDAVISNLN